MGPSTPVCGRVRSYRHQVNATDETQALEQRDVEILQLASMLFTAAETGRVLRLSRSTIEKERVEIAQRLGTRSIRVAVRIAYRDAFLPLPPRLMQALLDRIVNSGLN
jgi:DNA-binding NarL/FixJ family response regulator